MYEDVKIMKKRIISVFLVISIICCAFALSANAVNFDERIEYSCYGLDDIGYRPNVPNPLDVEGGALDLPLSYDPRVTNSTTQVKNQMNNGVCWTFATMTTLESKIYKETGLKENLSEEAMRYVQSNYLKEHIGENSDLGLYLRNPYEGGTVIAGTEYISQRNNAVSNNASWLSPNLTVDVQYFNNITWVNNIEQHINLKWPEQLNSSYATNYAKNIKYINFNDIKKEVYDNGAAYFTFNASGNYVNLSTGAFYNPVKDDSSAHAVAMVGWDDNYPKENFKESCRPKNNGAFLIKNSWGTGWGDDGYGWVSYEDATLNIHGGCFVVKDLSPVSKNEYTLSYDYLPITGEVTSQQSDIKRVITESEPYVCMANVYDVSELANEYGEVNRVTFYAKNIGDLYQVFIVPLRGDKFELPPIDNLGSSLANGTVNYEGYTTADFKNKFTFSNNTEKLAVIIKFNTDYNANKEIALCRERLYAGHYNPLTYPNESFVYCNDKWSDLSGGQISNCGNYCIRPTLVRREEITQNSNLSTNEVRYRGKDISINLNLNGNLL